MRIVSWNIQWGRGADGVIALPRTIAALQALDADVICLQEVSVNFPGLKGGHTGDQVAVLSSAFPGYQIAYGPCVDLCGAGAGVSFGNMVLARIPVLQVWRHLLPWPADESAPAMQRGCVEVLVDAAGVPLRVLTTHLEYYSATVRLAQAKALVRLQQEACALDRTPPAGKRDGGPFAPRPRPSSAVLCGDFNCKPDEPAYLAVQAAEGGEPWCDAWRAQANGVAHVPTVGLKGAEWPPAPYCCDYFFVSRDLVPSVRSLVVETDTAASDHQPLLLELGLV
ncbi:endonuclease/exonuclease/phosphatase family protein [Niveibacterium sp. 24ML]|uniref:endonuclease/exonuclease/phosphatase family protein n=1 Tax=Niveibacterium sp. 24ML TaxID=2985512 RepID=UPI00226DDBB1|nr:endonuclease/exonuclease/phosphatase family protein [Niveibacterium sp. 24ML]MCX9156117.1 endonuclease/exonuclease/phosphatase family protein [Niveibacterium sp. 24ML]